MARDRLLGFLLGAGFGVGIGMLLAPKSGDKTRGLLKEKADEGKEYLKRLSSELRDSATDIIESGKEAIGRQKDALGGRRGQQASVRRGGRTACTVRRPDGSLTSGSYVGRCISMGDYERRFFGVHRGRRTNRSDIRRVLHGQGHAG